MHTDNHKSAFASTALSSVLLASKLVTIVAAIFFSTPAFAFQASYRGTIVQEVTGTNDPLYHVGQKWVGYYEYKSDTIDGVFNVGYEYPPPDLETLDGRVYLPFAKEADSPIPGIEYNYGPGGSFLNLVGYPHAGELVVSGGQVTSFTWSFDQGGFYMYMNQDSFNAYSFYDTWATEPTTGGRVTFGRPYEVPEAFPTGVLLLPTLVLVCLRFSRSK